MELAEDITVIGLSCLDGHDAHFLPFCLGFALGVLLQRATLLTGLHLTKSCRRPLPLSEVGEGRRPRELSVLIPVQLYGAGLPLTQDVSLFRIQIRQLWDEWSS